MNKDINMLLEKLEPEIDEKCSKIIRKNKSFTCYY